MLCTRLPYCVRRVSKSSHSRSMIVAAGTPGPRGSNARIARSFESLGLLVWVAVLMRETLVRWSAWYMLALIAATSPARAHHARAVRGPPRAFAEAFRRRSSNREGSMRSARTIESPRSDGRGETNSPSSRPASSRRQAARGFGGFTPAATAEARTAAPHASATAAIQARDLMSTTHAHPRPGSRPARLPIRDVRLGFDLHQHVRGDQPPYLNQAGRREDGSEKLAVRLADRLPVIDVDDVHARAHHVFQPGPGPAQRRLDVLQSLHGLGV